MTTDELYARLESSGCVPQGKLEQLSAEDDPVLVVKVAPEGLLSLARFLATQEELTFDSLMCLTAIDTGEELEVVYHLFSMKHKHKIVVKVSVSKENPKVPSVEAVWPTANWHEREAFDLVGVVFEGHSDLRRILLPEDWEGHPLRKGYEFPKEYRGIPI